MDGQEERYQPRRGDLASRAFPSPQRPRTIINPRFMSDAGYNPQALIRVMEILDQVSDGSRPPEFYSTHPNPENRIARITETIRQKYPDGIPAGLTP